MKEITFENLSLRGLQMTTTPNEKDNLYNTVIFGTDRETGVEIVASGFHSKEFTSQMKALINANEQISKKHS